jgi:hypothetical protein
MSLLYPQKNYGAALRMSICLSRGECFCMEEEECLFYILERVSVLYIEKSLFFKKKINLFGNSVFFNPQKSVRTLPRRMSVLYHIFFDSRYTGSCSLQQKCLFCTEQRRLIVK